MRRSDILLAIIAAAEGEALGAVHLQKVAFLVAQQFDAEMPVNIYAFDKNDYGPFCVDIYHDVELLEYWGLARIELEGARGQKVYRAAEHVVFDEIDVPLHIKSYIKRTVAWAQEQSFQELVRSIYFLFPEYRENSVFPYSEDEAFLESLSRGLKQVSEGKVYPARARLEALRAKLEPEHAADPVVG